MPYRDVYVFKPPGTVWIHALAQLLLGRTMLGLRVFDIGWTVTTALVLAAVAERLFPRRRVALYAGLLFPFLYGAFDFWQSCQTDGWMNLPALGALWLALAAFEPGSRPSGQVMRVFAAGALLGVVACVKYTGLAFLAPIAAALIAPPRAFAGRLALLGAGVAATLAATGLWLWMGGAMPGFLDSQLGLVPTYVAKTGRAAGYLVGFGHFWQILATLRPLPPVLVCLVAGSVVVGLALWRGPCRPALVAVALVLAGVASCWAQNKYFRYHYLPVLPGAAVLGALALDALQRVRGGPLVALGLVLVGLGTSEYWARWTTLAQLATGSLTRQELWKSKAFRINKMSVADNVAAADWIARETSPGDRVFLWGYDPMVNFLAGRKTVSRFLYNYPFAVSWADSRYEAELLEALAAEPPKLFVVGSKDATPHVTRNNLDSKELLARFDGLQAFVDARYAPAATVGRFDIYRVRSSL
jgi:4-amino-4-deoxy-L-arabinose transferase-like glycosyltransferase